jgi:hypothetical protein
MGIEKSMLISRRALFLVLVKLIAKVLKSAATAA